MTKEIHDTSGSITFSLDDKYIFYSKLDNNHRARKIYRHKIGNYDDQDELIFEEKSEAFTVSIGLVQMKNIILFQLQITIPQNNIILLKMKKYQNQNL